MPLPPVRRQETLCARLRAAPSTWHGNVITRSRCAMPRQGAIEEVRNLGDATMSKCRSSHMLKIMNVTPRGVVSITSLCSNFDRRNGTNVMGRVSRHVACSLLSPLLGMLLELFCLFPDPAVVHTSSNKMAFSKVRPFREGSCVDGSINSRKLVCSENLVIWTCWRLEYGAGWLDC